MNKKVLAIVPVFNSPFPIVSRTIKSLVSQNYPYLRIIIIDDYSKQDLFEAIYREFSIEPRLTIIRNNKNLGFAKTLNKALELVKDETYFFILEHDCELLMENYIAQTVRHFDNEEVGAVCGENIASSTEDISSIKKIFVKHLSEDILDSNVKSMGFLLLKADAIRVSILKEVSGFQSAGGWKFASEEHIISSKIRNLGYSIIKDANLHFKGYWGGQESLLQNLKKEAIYGRGLGCALANGDSDLSIGKSDQLKAKKLSRIIQLMYISLTALSILLLFFNSTLSLVITDLSFAGYLAYLAKGSLAFSKAKDSLLFILTGYLRAWVYIPNLFLGLFYGLIYRFHHYQNRIRKGIP